MPNLPFFYFFFPFFFFFLFFPPLGFMDMDLLYFISVCLFAGKNCRSNTRECLDMVLISFVCIQRGLVTVTSAGSRARATRKYQSMETGVCHPPTVSAEQRLSCRQRYRKLLPKHCLVEQMLHCNRTSGSFLST